MGLIYNRELFEQVGLDPDRPPATWDEVRAAARKIAALGDGVVGYADYSAQNQGGWHFTAELYSQGGDVVSADGTKATVDTPRPAPSSGPSTTCGGRTSRWAASSCSSSTTPSR